MQLSSDVFAQNKQPNKNKQQPVGPPTHPTESLSTAFKALYILATVAVISLDVKSSLESHRCTLTSPVSCISKSLIQD